MGFRQYCRPNWKCQAPKHLDKILEDKIPADLCLLYFPQWPALFRPSLLQGWRLDLTPTKSVFHDHHSGDTRNALPLEWAAVSMRIPILASSGMSSNLLCFAARDHQASSDLLLFLCSFMIQECSLVITIAFCWLPAFTWVCTTPYPSFQPFYVKTQNLRRKAHQKYYEDAAHLAIPQRGDSYLLLGIHDQLDRTLN